MKNLVKKAITFAMAVSMMLTCVACGSTAESTEDMTTTEPSIQEETMQVEEFVDENLEDGKEGTIYTLTFTNGEDYDATALPEKHFLGATAAFSGMKMDNIMVKVKFYDDGTYKYVATDNSAVEISHERWMHREYVWAGAYTTEENVFTLEVPTTATLNFQGGPAYESMAAMIGELGSFTHETNPELLTMFQEATATIDGETISFTVAYSGDVEAGPQEGQIKVACIGDSITYGHGVTNWETENYPAVLQTLLGDEYYVVNYGFIGACVNPDGDKPYIEQSVYQQSLDYNADIIIFMLGTNDSKVENWTSAEDFVKNYKALLDTYFADGRAPKVYIGLCAKGYDIENSEIEYGIQPAIVDEIVKALSDFYTTDSVEIVDIHSLTEAHPEWFTVDGVHPNTEGATAIAETMADAIK